MFLDFVDVAPARGVYYGGDAGAKDAVAYDNAIWMVEYPKTTRDLVNPQISYTTSPLSEYIGSQIYAALGIPVHEVQLGTRKGKVVAACKDFTRSGGGEVICQLVPFHDLKNSFMASDVDSYSGTGSDTRLDEVLATIGGQEDLCAVHGVMERFWDMFVIDAFIGNNDRNNGNWGILLNGTHVSLAPVYDNGNAFFNKRSAYRYAGLDNEGQRINPFRFIQAQESIDCTAALERFLSSLDMRRVEEIIHAIPEAYSSLSVMPQIQKEFYLALLDRRARYLQSIINIGR